MNSQVIFTLDSTIKAKAMKRAKHAGIPFASYLRQAAEDFAEGKSSMEIVGEEIPNAKTARILRAALRDIAKGNKRNFSPAFSDIRDMQRWMKERK